MTIRHRCTHLSRERARLWRRLLSTLAVAATLLWTSSLAAAERTVVFGDVHGGVTELRALLQALDVTNADHDWAGGTTRLVSLGDLLDRGPDSRQVLDLLMKLEQQAAAAGGGVHTVLGNHEVMNLTGDLRYVSTSEFAAFAADEDPALRAEALAAFRAARDPTAEDDGDAEFQRRYPPGFFGHRVAFSPDGRYGRWLLKKPQVLVLDRIAFVHGGLSSHFATESVADFNARAAADLAGLLAGGHALVAQGMLPAWADLLTAEPLDPEVPLPDEFLRFRQSFGFDPHGPTWYRGTAACHPLIEENRFQSVLRARGLERIVMGHTTTNPRIIQTRFDGRAVLADTGMYAAYYHGNPSALVFERGDMKTLTLGSDGVLTPRVGQPAIDRRAGDEADLQEALGAALAELGRLPAEPFTVELAGRTYAARLHRAGRARNSVLAAQALDKLLGLGLTAPARALDGKAGRGTVEIVPERSLTEVERQTQGVGRPNWCAGSNDYQLMYAFDYLIGNEARRADSIHYDRATWLMWLTGHDAVFPTTTRMPAYLENIRVNLPVALAERLARIDDAGLESDLGDYLGDRQRKALLERRDAMLAAWPVEQ